jgi:hypothetical protein
MALLGCDCEDDPQYERAEYSSDVHGVFIEGPLLASTSPATAEVFMMLHILQNDLPQNKGSTSASMAATSFGSKWAMLRVRGCRRLSLSASATHADVADE